MIRSSAMIGWSGAGLGCRRRRAFTLVELLVAVGIIGILSSLVLLALYGAMEEARESRTRSQIAHIHEQLMYRWQSYSSRSVPLRLPSSFITLDGSGNQQRQRMTARIAAQLRLAVLRDLQRMEMPDRRTDVLDGPAPLFYENDLDRNAKTPGIWMVYPFPNPSVPPVTAAPPALRDAYIQFVASRQKLTGRAWSPTFQGAECLYMILANLREGGTSALDFFRTSEIGDVDDDGMPEVLDAWGRPIEFIRWPAGFSPFPGPDLQWGVAGVDDDQDGIVDNSTEAGWIGSDDLPSPSDLQDRKVGAQRAPDGREILSGGGGDPFDPFKVDYRWWNTDSGGNPVRTDDPFALYPLVFSAGRDQIYDIVTDTTDLDPSLPPLHYVLTQRSNDRVLDGMGNAIQIPGTPGPYPNDPYVALNNLFEVGRPADLPSFAWPTSSRSVPVDGVDNSRDNIHNHLIEAR